ncbi:hypothetical protein C7G42_07860 [Bradyrhizobium sp. MOS003]|nr:hypothetical protein C7G42_07860 [Bradyrhizobium sp. MOS003]
MKVTPSEPIGLALGGHDGFLVIGHGDHFVEICGHGEPAALLGRPHPGEVDASEARSEEQHLSVPDQLFEIVSDCQASAERTPSIDQRDIEFGANPDQPRLEIGCGEFVERLLVSDDDVDLHVRGGIAKSVSEIALAVAVTDVGRPIGNE